MKKSMKTGSSTKRKPAPPVFELEPVVTTHPPRATGAHNATLAPRSGLTPLSTRRIGPANDFACASPAAARHGCRVGLMRSELTGLQIDSGGRLGHTPRYRRAAPSSVLVLRICGVLVAEDVVAERTEVCPPVRRLRALGDPDETEQK